jgi:radical SAM superfamily enzyme with C-terminal helix-hairpin-helix motif
MAFGVQSIDRQVLKNNTGVLVKAAKVFRIVATINSVGTESFAGYTYPKQLFLALGPQERRTGCGCRQ